MGKIEKIVKSEIMRLAKREVRAAFFPLRREVHRMRLNLSRLSKNFTLLDRLAKERIRQDDSKKLKMETNLEEAKAARFTPERIRLLRNKLGISQKGLSVLAGVSMGAVASWEKGKFHPKLEKKAALVAIRKLRKRDVKKILTSRSEEAKKKKPPKRKTKANK